MIQKPIVPPPVIFIGSALIMAYLPNPYPLSTNVLIAYLMVLVSSVIAFFSLWEFYKSKANINPIHLEKSNVFVADGIYSFSRNPMYLSLAGGMGGLFAKCGQFSRCFSVYLFHHAMAN